MWGPGSCIMWNKTRNNNDYDNNNIRLISRAQIFYLELLRDFIPYFMFIFPILHMGKLRLSEISNSSVFLK